MINEYLYYYNENTNLTQKEKRNRKKSNPLHLKHFFIIRDKQDKLAFKKIRKICICCSKKLPKKRWKYCSTSCNNKIRYSKNSEKIKKYTKEYAKRRILIDESYYLSRILRTRLYIALKQHQSQIRLKEISIDVTSIKKKIGKKPSKEYHLDHIVPLSKFDLTEKTEILIAFHPLNLRWLLAKENLKKHCSITSMNKDDLINLIKN